jgi:hypothetical protein
VLARQLALERRRWKRRSGGQAYVIGPPAALGRRVNRWGDLFDYGLARDAYMHGHREAFRDVAFGGRLAALTTSTRTETA